MTETKLAHAELLDPILRDFQSLAEEDLRAVIAFAAAAADEDLQAPLAVAVGDQMGRCGCSASRLRMTKPATPPSASELVFYQGEDRRTRVQLRLDGSTAWLTERLLAELHPVAVPTINEHLANIFADQEVDPAPTVRKFRIVQTEGNREVETSEPDAFDKAAKQLGRKKPGKPEKGGR